VTAGVQKDVKLEKYNQPKQQLPSKFVEGAAQQPLMAQQSLPPNGSSELPSEGSAGTVNQYMHDDPRSGTGINLQTILAGHSSSRKKLKLRKDS
jgi:hypothetical protein